MWRTRSRSNWRPPRRNAFAPRLPAIRALMISIYARLALTAQADEKSHEQQIAMLREAVAEDPDYAEAWSRYSQAYVHMGDAYRAPREILCSAREAAIKAVSLDDQLSDAHLVLGGIALTYDWNFPLAKREFERATRSTPTLLWLMGLAGTWPVRNAIMSRRARRWRPRAGSIRSIRGRGGGSQGSPLRKAIIRARSSRRAGHGDRSGVSLRRGSDRPCLCRNGALE